MQGISKEVYEYVLKCEREALPSERTTWFIKIITAAESSASLRRYSKSFRQSGSQNEVVETSYKSAFRAEFLDVVKKVQNYKFGYLHPELEEKGFITFDETETIAKVFEELPEQMIRELIEAAKGDAILEENDRKK